VIEFLQCFGTAGCVIWPVEMTYNVSSGTLKVTVSVTVAELSGNRESSVELIKLDVSRTFPQLCIFQQVSNHCFVILRLHRMHGVLTVLMDFCLSICLSLGLNRRQRMQCVPCAWGHSVQPLLNYFGHLLLNFILTLNYDFVANVILIITCYWLCNVVKWSFAAGMSICLTRDLCPSGLTC